MIIKKILPENLVAQDNLIYLYKFQNTVEDATYMHQLLAGEEDEYVAPWGDKYSVEECQGRIQLCHSGRIYLYGILFYVKGEYHLVGLTGINYNDNKDCINHVPGFYQSHFSQILISQKYQNMGLGFRCMKLLIDHAKTLPIKKLYAVIYHSNRKSIYLHYKLGFQKDTDLADIVFMTLPMDK